MNESISKLMVALNVTISILLLILVVRINSIEGTIVNIEYTKVGGQSNYEKISKINKEQANEFIAQYEKKENIPSVSLEKPKSDIIPETTDIKTPLLSKQQIDSILKNTFIYGNKDSKIAVIEYSDLECAYCKRHYLNTMKGLKENYKTSVSFIFKNFPLSFHENAKQEHIAALCVGKINGADDYNKFIGNIFEQTKSGGTGFPLNKISILIKEMGVDEKLFSECILSAKEQEAKIESEINEGKSLFGITGTPGTVIINKETGEYKVFNGAVSYLSIKSSVDIFLK